MQFQDFGGASSYGFSLQRTSAVEPPIATARSDQIANLVMDDLQGGTVVNGAEATASAIDSKSRSRGEEERKGEEVHFVCFAKEKMFES